MSELLFSFEGRINRQPFWIVNLVISIVLLIASFIDQALTGDGDGIVSLVATLILLWPALAVQAKRWHDRDKSAWWLLINLIPIIGFIWVLVENGCLAGTPGSNRFGDNPLGK